MHSVKTTRCSLATFIDEPGLYELVSGSKLPAAKKFLDWVFPQASPPIRKYGQYKLFDNPNNHMFKIENETDLHTKVVQYIRRFYSGTILIGGFGENQDTDTKRINSWKKGYQKGQPDIIIMNNHMNYSGFCIRFKSPTNNYQVSEAYLEMKGKYKEDGYKFIISIDYDRIIVRIYNYMKGLRLPCPHCSHRGFSSQDTFKSRLKVIHRTEK